MNDKIIKGLIFPVVGGMFLFYLEYGTIVPSQGPPTQAGPPIQAGSVIPSQPKDYSDTAQRPSWCNNRLNRAERTICNTASLWKVEAKNLQVYNQLLDNTGSSSEKKGLKSELGQWLKQRNAECLRSVEACSEVYRTRIRDLESRI